jgi:hypothetical protein
MNGRLSQAVHQVAQSSDRVLATVRTNATRRRIRALAEAAAKERVAESEAELRSPSPKPVALDLEKVGYKTDAQDEPRPSEPFVTMEGDQSGQSGRRTSPPKPVALDIEKVANKVGVENARRAADAFAKMEADLVSGQPIQKDTARVYIDFFSRLLRLGWLRRRH